MKSRTCLIIFAIAVMSVTSSAFSSFHTLAAMHDDPISGQWDATFSADTGDVTFTRSMKLKVDGETVSGSFDSERTGKGTVKGTWAANKLTVTLESEQGKMEVIALLKNGKLKGTWDVGHMQGKMEADKK